MFAPHYTADGQTNRTYRMPCKLRGIVSAIFCVAMAATVFIPQSSLRAEEPTNIRPQLGIWFGPVTPVPFTEESEVLNTFLGGGIFFRINWPFNLIRSEIGTSWSYYNSIHTAGLHLVPIYYAAVYRLPVNLPLQFQVKAGGGTVYVDTEPENKNRWDPLGYIGFEGSFPAGRRVNIGLRIDYQFVMESHLDPPPGAPRDFDVGNYNFLNFGLMVNFYLSR